MNSETFSKVASGVQNIAVVIGLAVGAWWALKTFVFLNPGYYEQGWETLGRSPEVIKAELAIEPLDKQAKQFEVTLTITNASKTLHQSLAPREVALMSLQAGQTTPVRIPFLSSTSDGKSFVIPIAESRQLRFLATFPSEGVYLLEANLCVSVQKNCIVQKYVQVEAANPSIERTSSSLRPSSAIHVKR